MSSLVGQAYSGPDTDLSARNRAIFSHVMEVKVLLAQAGEVSYCYVLSYEELFIY